MRDAGGGMGNDKVWMPMKATCWRESEHPHVPALCLISDHDHGHEVQTSRAGNPVCVRRWAVEVER